MGPGQAGTAWLKGRRLLVFLGMVGGVMLAGLAWAMVPTTSKLYEARQEIHRLEQRLARADRDLQNMRLNGGAGKKERFLLQQLTRLQPGTARVLDRVWDVAQNRGIQPDLLAGMVQVESNFNPTAVSGRGAYGLMQINLAVWADALCIDRNRIFDIAYNLDLGARILSHYLEIANGNWRRALHLYNNGFLYGNARYPLKVGQTLSPELRRDLLGRFDAPSSEGQWVGRAMRMSGGETLAQGASTQANR